MARELVRVANPARNTRNLYRVPKKQWAKWSDAGRAVFNNVMRTMRDQSLFLHPKTKPVPAAQWRTTAWNAAWIAADEATAA